MELIYFRGLNCHLASVLSIAGALGINYLDAFATLWSETEFTDEAAYDLFTSKRVFANLEALGVRTEALDGQGMKGEGSRIPDDTLFLVGMDSFRIPWHPVFQHFHSPHYFFAQKETAHSVLCFDPVYHEKNQRLTLGHMFSFAFALSRVHRVNASPPKHGVWQEAKAVLRCHPKTRERLLAEIGACRDGGNRPIALLIKEISAMISNRYLFERFLHGPSSGFEWDNAFFDGAFLEKWEAVRNGLYKASIVKDNKRVMDEVYDLFDGLMQAEMAMARAIIETGMMPEPSEVAPGHHHENGTVLCIAKASSKGGSLPEDA